MGVREGEKSPRSVGSEMMLQKTCGSMGPSDDQHHVREQLAAIKHGRKRCS